MSPVVFVRDDEVRASSRDVADAFGKEHRHVLRAIDDLVAQAPELGTAQFWAVALRGSGQRAYRAFEMNRTGFMLLVMGFTGQKALQIKIAWIARFDQMERALRAQADNDDDPPLVEHGDDLLERQVLLAECRVLNKAYGRRAVRAHLMASGRFEHIRPIADAIEATEQRSLPSAPAGKQEAGPIWDWSNDRTRQNAMTVTPVKVLYGNYEDWCRRRGLRPVTVQAFRSGMAAMFGHQRYARGYGLELI